MLTKFSQDQFNSLIQSKFEISFDLFCNSRFSHQKIWKQLLMHIDADDLDTFEDEFVVEGFCQFQIGELQEF